MISIIFRCCNSLIFSFLKFYLCEPGTCIYICSARETYNDLVNPCIAYIDIEVSSMYMIAYHIHCVARRRVSSIF